MDGETSPREPVTLRPVLEEAKRIAYRLIAIVELLEHEYGGDRGTDERS